MTDLPGGIWTRKGIERVIKGERVRAKGRGWENRWGERLKRKFERESMKKGVKERKRERGRRREKKIASD